MSELVGLAEQKIEAASQRRLKSLPGEVEAIKREHAAKGLARSGATLKRVRALYIATLHAHGETIAGEYKWAIQHALLASQTWSEKLVSEVPGQLEPLMRAAAEQLTMLAAFTGRPELAERLINEVEAERLVAEGNAKLAVRSAFAEKKRGFVRSLPGTLWSLAIKVFRPGG
jgi:hypothetical protein